MQFVAKAFFARGLKKARSQGSMNLYGGPDVSLGKFLMQKCAPCLRVSVANHVCKTPTLNSATSGFNAAASSAWVMASRVSIGSIILSIHSRAAP
jgi:hypothetical protein